MPRKSNKQPTDEELAREAPFKYTTFHVAPAINGKNVSSNYLKTDGQTWWARQAASEGKDVLPYAGRGRKRKNPPLGNAQAREAPSALGEVGEADKPSEEDEDSEREEVAPAARTMVIHPGSRNLRIGRASDHAPLIIPHVIARRKRTNGLHDTGEVQVQEDKEVDGQQEERRQEEMDVEEGEPVDPLGRKFDAIRTDLRSIMRSMKLRGVSNGKGLAASYNEGVEEVFIQEHNDPYPVEWTKADGKDYVVGEGALRLPCFSQPEPKGSSSAVNSEIWELFYPLHCGNFNFAGYNKAYSTKSSVYQALLNDLETIWTHAIVHDLGIDRREIKTMSVILIVPDLFDKYYIRELSDLLLGSMGFAQICVQQESLCASFGAGISSACIVDVGATRINVACVDEGMVLPETRISLSYGGDDITEIWTALLERANFPYREVDIQKRMSDRMLMTELKEKMNTMNPSDFGLNMYDFYVRLPGEMTRKYMLRVYDEVIVAPMTLFHPRVIDFDRKPSSRDEEDLWGADQDDLNDSTLFAVTNAMQNCTRHLLPPVSASVPGIIPGNTTTGPQLSVHTPSEHLAGATAGTLSGLESRAETPSEQAGTPAPGGLTPLGGTTGPSNTPLGQAQTSSGPPTTQNGPQVPAVDFSWEASKVPLDVAVWNSLLASGTEDRIKRFANAIVFVGGVGRMPGLASALEAKLVMHMSSNPTTGHASAQVIPSPRDMDPRVLPWKGVSVLARLEGVEDFWLRRRDWEDLGWRALKEKTLYL